MPSMGFLEIMDSLRDGGSRGVGQLKTLQYPRDFPRLPWVPPLPLPLDPINTDWLSWKRRPAAAQTEGTGPQLV